MSSDAQVPPLAVTIEGFCSAIRELVNDFARRHPSDPLVDRIRKRVNAAISLVPAQVVELAGFYLFKYHDQIYAGDEAFFLNAENFNQDLAQGERERADLVSQAMPKIFSSWGTLSPQERDWYKECAAALVDMYLDYEAARGRA